MPTSGSIYTVRGLMVWIVLVCWSPPANADDAAGNLRAQLANLAARHDVTVRGLDKIDMADPPGRAAGDFEAQATALLADYSLMLIEDDHGQIEKLVISGRKHSGPPPDQLVSVALQPDRAGHFVTAELTGPNGAVHQIRLLLDTGASLCVLPRAWKTPLGFDGQTLQTATLQTAGGRIQGERAVLYSMRVGHALAREVQIAFVDGEQLGLSGLLGRSFLARYATTIDLAANRLTLEPRPR